MKTPIIFLVSFLLLGELLGQVTFQKAYNTYSNGTPTVMQTAEGGYMIMGRKLIKINAFGDTLWTKSYNFGSSAVTCARPTNDGGFSISGYTNTFGAGFSDIFLSKTDSLGNIEWSKAYGGPNHEEAYSMQQTADSGFMIAGHTRSYGSGGLNIYLIRTDVDGNLLWTKTIGGGGDATAKSVQQTNDGGWIVASMYGVLDSGSYDNTGHLAKLDPNGNVVWSKSYNGPGTENINCIRQTIDGGYIFTGMTSYYTSTNVVALFIMKTDSAGSLLWSHYYNRDFSFGSAIEPTSDGGYIATGSFGLPSTQMDLCLIKINSLGDTLWTRAFGGPDAEGGTSVKETNDGGYIVVGTSTGFGYGFYMVKTDNFGNSPCNQMSTFFSITDTLVVESPVPITSSSGGSATPFVATVLNGTTVVPICFTMDIPESTPDPSFLLYPNPSSGNFKVMTKNALEAITVQVFNSLGEIIFEKEMLNTSTEEIQLHHPAAGIYFVKLTAEESQTIQKLVVQ